MRKKLLFFLLAYFPISVYSQCPDGVSATISAHTNDSCNANCMATATATASGGTPAYTYAWAPSGGTKASASNLCAGTYTVTVTDSKGCTATASVSITQPTPIAISIVSTTGSNCGSCNGTATAAASGGTSPYNYVWSPKGGNKAAATGLCAGNDTVTVTDANGCTATLVVFIDNNNITTSIATNNVKCNGKCTGSATATVTGGNVPFTYAWSPAGGTTNAATGLCVGTYSIVVTDHKGCLSHAATTITQPTAFVVTTYEVDDVGAPCNGIAAVITSGATSPYTYLWLPALQTKDTITGQCPGTFCCTITDHNGCTQTNCVKVGLNSPLPVTLTSFTATYVEQSNSVVIAWTVATQLNNKEFIIQKTVDGITYEDVATIAGGGTTSLPESYTATDHDPTEGTSYYRLVQVDIDGNPNYFTPVVITITTISPHSSLSIYPNPATSHATLVYIATDKNPLSVYIIDILGRTVNSFIWDNIKLGENIIPINTAGLIPGIYDFHVSEEKNAFDLKFIKQ